MGDILKSTAKSTNKKKSVPPFELFKINQQTAWPARRAELELCAAQGRFPMRIKIKSAATALALCLVSHRGGEGVGKLLSIQNSLCAQLL